MNHWGKFLSAVLIALLCMLCVVPCAVWAEDTEDSAAEQTEVGTEGDATENTETSGNQVGEKKIEVIESGDAPLLTILDIEVPEKAGVGQEFKAVVTVRNMGTGVAVSPELRFTEGKDRKVLESFSVPYGENGVFDPGVAMIESGATRLFVVTLKVNEDTKELPSGAKYQLNCTLAAGNIHYKDYAGDSKQFSTTQSFHLEVSYSMMQPSFIVENVTFNPEVTEGVTETIATIHLKNASDTKANNVVTTLAGMEIGSTGERNISVMDLTSTKQLYTVSGNQKVTVDYKLNLNRNRSNNEMLLTLTYNGQEAPQEIMLNLPLPSQQSANGREPKVIIQRYSVSPSKVLAGNNVTLSLYIENTNSLPVNNVSIQLDVPTETSSNGGAVSSGTVFSPINSSNTFYIDRIEGKDVAVKNIDMYVDPNALAKTYIMPVNISYEGKDGTKYTASDNVNIPVGQESKVDIISTNVQAYGNVGEPLSISMEFVNIGKVNLSNFKVSLEGEVPGKGENVYYIGAFNVGDSDEYSAMIYPEAEGVLSGAIRISYIDGDNQEVMVDVPFESEIGPAIDYSAMMEPEMPMPEPEPTFVDRLKANIWTILIGIVAMAEGVVLFRSKRKAKAEEELIDG